jgi:hypothetical protein
MRTLFLKQSIDPFGPWRPVDYRYEDPASILEKFYYKPTLWEMTCLLQADWKIIPSRGTGVFNRYVAQFPRLAKLLARHQTEVVSPDSIDFAAYDIVISTEACLTESLTARFPHTLFLYFMNEHDNQEYNEQRNAPDAAYDYFLDHMCGVTAERVGDFPLSIPMPYLRAPAVVRKIFPRDRDRAARPQIWIDARYIARAALGSARALWTERCDQYAHELRAKHEVEIFYRSNIYRDYYDVQDPSSRDAPGYYADMRHADYFIGLTATGAGQALCDAASLGLACVGTPLLVYHRMTCVPQALCADLGPAISLVKQWHHDERLRASIVASQDAAIDLNMRQRPLRCLELARAKKRKPSARRSATISP